MTDTPQQPSRLDRIESILATVAEQQATNTQAIAFAGVACDCGDRIYQR